jgi:formate dehydrogenase subunit delta
MSAKQVDHLVKMANEIALNLGASRDEQLAARRTGEHIVRFWTPAMRTQLLEFWRDGGEGISPAVAQFLESEELAVGH